MRQERLESTSTTRLGLWAATLFLAAVVGLPIVAGTQVIQVADVHTGAGPVSGSGPRDLVSVGDTGFFTAAESQHGRELWASDGTSGGTRLLRDIYPGEGGGVGPGVGFEGMFYFTANDGDHGSELWRSDGTPAGTVMVMDIRPGPSSSSPAELAVVGSRLYFSAYTDAEGRELYYVEAGQVLSVGDVRVGEEGLDPEDIMPWGPLIVFSGKSTDEGTELWRSNGTLAGTVLLEDVVPGTDSSTPIPLFDLHPALFFSATDSVHGRELWFLQPAAVHPGNDVTFLGDLATGTFGSGTPRSSNPRSMMVVGSALLFVASGDKGAELWATNGTAAGTQVFVDINPGSTSGVYGTPVLHDGQIYFSGWDGDNGREPWVSDGTVLGTFMLEDIASDALSSSPIGFVPLDDGLVYFLTTNADGFELWRTDGTEDGTTRRHYRDDGTELAYDVDLTALNGSQLLFAAGDDFAGEELWRTGASGGSQRLKNIAPDLGDGYPLFYLPVGDRLFFTAQNEDGRELWVSESDLTTLGTRQVEDLRPGAPSSNPALFLDWGGDLLYRAYSPDEGYELRRIGDPDLGSTVVADIDLGTGSSSPHLIGQLQSQLLLAADDGDAGRELWKSDGTELGTSMIDDIWMGEENGVQGYTQGVELGGYYYFEAEDGLRGEEVWRTDGESVEIVRDINLGAADSYPIGFTAFAGEVYFSAQGEEGRELWKTDGSAQGTEVVRDIDPAGSGNPNPIGVVASHLLFVAFRPDIGVELWRTDGTEEETEPLVDIWPGAGSSSPRSAVLAGGLLYFVAKDPTFGQEIWRSDGSASGTFRVTDLRPGGLSGQPTQLVALPDGGFVFSAYSEDASVELWRSDGTGAGTFRVTDIAPGPEPSNPNGMTVFGDWVVFTATDGATGREVYAYRWNPEPPFFADDFEGGDVGAWSGAVE